jgi:DNA-binding protein HU-beta
MNRRDLVAVLAERTESDKRTADAALQAFIDTVTETVASGEPVAITGFAKFARVDRAARMGRNPQTGEAIRIKASRRVRVTPLKAFKDAVLTGKATKKAPAKKAATAKKTTAKKTTAKKTTARKTTARKAPAKKTTAKKTTAKKTAKKTAVKRPTARRR